MELDSHLLSLNIAAEQQHSIISHWESRNNSVYRKSRDSSTSRPGTDYQVDEIDDADLLEGDLEDDVAVQQAWTELTEITREQERYAEMRAAAEKELEACRKCSAMLEDQLPSRINSDEERELLALMLRVHELEADKMMLQTERLVKQHELRRRELMLLRYDRQRQISDEIITRQRRIMEAERNIENDAFPEDYSFTSSVSNDWQRGVERANGLVTGSRRRTGGNGIHSSSDSPF
ncbi:kinesin-like protein KIF19 isoform X2 [Temnothorax curvispinosus]|uniref:Kinesin-like protein KIF19 isoform X2 n=1 Tax=Temnothorax curvispinosus TaxID=300111 RepID=A0A6J1QBE5_9HYME|nr:kinesin-like protein KIF19 isoform X2 [Temnothorax curvispinosus]